MSGSSASTSGFDTGLPPLASSKCVPPTRRDTKMPLWPLESSSAQAIHGVVAPPGVSVPAATRGSSAPCVRVRVERRVALGRRVLGRSAELVVAGVVERRRQAVAHDHPVEVATAVVDGLGGEHHVVVVQAVDLAVVDLVPGDPRHGVVRAGERDVGLDAVARRVDVERRVGSRLERIGLQAPVADLLPAERADGRAAARQVGRAVGLLDAARDEDLIDRVVGVSTVLLLPGDPRHRVVAGRGRAAGEGGVLGLLVGVDVQRRDLVVGSTVLPFGDPRVLRRGEPAGEDVRLVAEMRVGLVPRRPRHGAACTGEVDRRRLGLLITLDVQRLALRLPHAVLERAHEDLLLAAGLLLECRPRDADAAGRERAADDV